MFDFFSLINYQQNIQHPCKFRNMNQSKRMRRNRLAIMAFSSLDSGYQMLNMYSSVAGIEFWNRDVRCRSLLSRIRMFDNKFVLSVCTVKMSCYWFDYTFCKEVTSGIFELTLPNFRRRRIVDLQWTCQEFKFGDCDRFGLKPQKRTASLIRDVFAKVKCALFVLLTVVFCSTRALQHKRIREAASVKVLGYSLVTLRSRVYPTRIDVTWINRWTN